MTFRGTRALFSRGLKEWSTVVIQNEAACNFASLTIAINFYSINPSNIGKKRPFLS